MILYESYVSELSINDIDFQYVELSINQRDIDNEEKPSLQSILFPHSDLINGNPMRYKQCRNAIVDHENIDIIKELKIHLPKVYKTKSAKKIKEIMQFLLDRSVPQLFGREQLNALFHDKPWWTGAAIHVSYDPGYNDKYNRTKQRGLNLSEMFDYFRDRNKIKNKNMYITKDNSDNESISMKGVTVYYHIPKCASSSTRQVLFNLGGTRIHWTQSMLIGYAGLNQQLFNNIPIKCGFTFIRHPLHRFISAYYTINLMIKQDINNPTKSSQEKRNLWKNLQGNLKFMHFSLKTDRNKECFLRIQMFINEVIYNSWKWIDRYKTYESRRIMEHIGTQTGHFLASFDNFDIDYFGRVEYYQQHLTKLSLKMEECGYLHNITKENIPHLMDSNIHKSKIPHHKFNRTLVDVYYVLAIDQDLYNKLIDYYYQDFICFGYNMSYSNFMQYIYTHDPLFNVQEFNNTVFSDG